MTPLLESFKINYVMGTYEKLFQKLLNGKSDAEILFTDICHLMQKLGFEQRIRGDHHIFTRNDIKEIINLQPNNSRGKPYQMKQVRDIIVRYKISLENNREK